MKVLNSSRIPTAQLRPLIEFALSQGDRSSRLARFVFTDAPPGETCSGRAHWNEGDDAAYPSLVELRLSSPDPRFYPRFDQHVPELEPTRLESWDEEALLVISHELRHVAQFWTENMDAHEMEIDAEAFAIQTLHDWRALNRNITRAA